MAEEYNNKENYVYANIKQGIMNLIMQHNLSYNPQHKKWSFPLRVSSVNVTNPQFSADLATFSEKIFNGKLHFFGNDHHNIKLPPQIYTTASPLAITNPLFWFKPTFMPLNVYWVCHCYSYYYTMVMKSLNIWVLYMY